MKVLKTIAIISVLALGACAPGLDAGQEQALAVSSYDTQAQPTAMQKVPEKTEVSVIFKFKSGHVISFTF